MPKSEKVHNSVKYHRILLNVSQVIYIMYPNSMPDIVILAQAVLRYFVDKVALLYKIPKSEKGDNSVKYLRHFPKT